LISDQTLLYTFSRICYYGYVLEQVLIFISFQAARQEKQENRAEAVRANKDAVNAKQVNK